MCACGSANAHGSKDFTFRGQQGKIIIDIFITMKSEHNSGQGVLPGLAWSDSWGERGSCRGIMLQNGIDILHSIYIDYTLPGK